MDGEQLPVDSGTELTIGEDLFDGNRWTTGVVLLITFHQKRPNPGGVPIWNCLDMCVTVANCGSQRCWFLNSFAQLRDHGSFKRDVQQFSSGPPW